MSDTDSSHLRNTSEETISSSSTAPSYQMILGHIMSSPSTYEIPLRTMYTLNCASRLQAAPSNSSSPMLAPTPPSVSPTISQFAGAFEMMHASSSYSTTSLISQISQLPAQPCSLPPTFITTFVKRCFTHDMNLVDFPQALTALDYLKDLEMRRRKEVAAVWSRLGVDADHIKAGIDARTTSYPEAAEWIKNAEVNDKHADSLYTQLFISLRRWVLINEMSLMPFNKHNCTAMINTLYPPSVGVQPTSKLTHKMLNKQRNGYFRYARSVENRGVGVLMTLQRQGAADGEDNGWAAAHRRLEQYLRVANSSIAECRDVTGMAYFRPAPPTAPLPPIPVRRITPSAPSNDENPTTPPKFRKIDSGVDFEGRAESSLGGRISDASSSRPLISTVDPHKTPATPRRRTAIERIAKEINFFKRDWPKVEEIIKPAPKTPSKPKEPKTPSKPKEPKTPSKPVELKEGITPRTLRKIRSLGGLRDMTHNNASSASVSSRFGQKGSMFFDKEMMRGERMAYEERVGLKGNKLGYSNTN